jgi:aromatic ring-cleaving dioxygenase
VLCVLEKPRVDSSSVAQHSAGLTENNIGPHAGAIYSRLFKYTQHTAGLTENNIGPHAGAIYSRLFKYTQHTAGIVEFYFTN